MSTSIHADFKQTVPVSARRFERSPFHGCYATPQTVMGVYAGRFYPIYNGEDPAEGYWALRRRAALYDVPERPVQIEGPDAVALLERVFARPVASLKPGRGRYAIACTPAGGVFIDGILFRLDERRFWYVQPEGALEAWLAAHAGGLEVTVSDPRSWVLQIQGPASLEVMREASDGAIDETLGYFHAGFFELGGQRLFVSRTGWTGELGFEVYTQGSATDAPRLWDHLLAAGRPHGLVHSTIASMEIRRIEAAILDNGSDMDAGMTPFAAGLGAFVDLEKPDFVGREALLAADRGRLLYGLTCAAAAPDIGSPVRDGDAVVGRVTAGAWSPYLGCGIGYVRFAAPGEWIGRRLSVGIGEAEPAACEIVALPFYDPEKRIPRGLDRSIP